MNNNDDKKGKTDNNNTKTNKEKNKLWNKNHKKKNKKNKNKNNNKNNTKKNCKEMAIPSFGLSRGISLSHICPPPPKGVKPTSCLFECEVSGFSENSQAMADACLSLKPTGGGA